MCCVCLVIRISFLGRGRKSWLSLQMCLIRVHDECDSNNKIMSANWVLSTNILAGRPQQYPDANESKACCKIDGLEACCGDR